MINFKHFNSFGAKNKKAFRVGKKILSSVNGRVCFIKNERLLNSIKHYTLSIQNDAKKRHILLSEDAVKKEYFVIE